ncbi:hypothetical protein KSP40_PGU001247 [Platanthera guangdongensis]|uniref:Uncharacterized protein n=1 Tax=Platanthera guangdongensis TaxID=2320717 RepID=A0ABR2MTF5_9ASPA
MFIQRQYCSPPNRFFSLKMPLPPLNKAQNLLSITPLLDPFLRLHTFRARIPTISGRLRAKFQPKTPKRFEQIEADAENGDLEKGDGEECSSGGGSESDKEDYEAADEEFSHASVYRGRRDEKDYDRDPELADILGSCFDDPKKAQSKVDERIRRKRSKILHTKTGSATPMKVRFNKRFEHSISLVALGAATL